MNDLAPILIPALCGVVGAAITAIVTAMANKRKASVADSKVKVDASSVLLNASSELREFVQRLWAEERESHIREKQSLIDELAHLKVRIADLEQAKREDFDVMRNSAFREAELIKKIAELEAKELKTNATIEELRNEIQKLRTTADLGH